MLERMKRRGFLKAALGGAAAVALGEMTGRREAEAITICKRVANACAGGCNSTCYGFCNNGFGKGCPACSVCTDPEPEPSDPCALVNNACAATATTPACGFSCGLFCATSTCAVCEECFPPE